MCVQHTLRIYQIERKIELHLIKKIYLGCGNIVYIKKENKMPNSKWICLNLLSHASNIKSTFKQDIFTSHLQRKHNMNSTFPAFEQIWFSNYKIESDGSKVCYIKVGFNNTIRIWSNETLLAHVKDQKF